MAQWADGGGHSSNRYQQLARVFGTWLAALCAYELQTVRKELCLSAERGRNWKKGWQREKEQRESTEASLRTQEAKSAAAEDAAARVLRAASEHSALTAKVAAAGDEGGAEAAGAGEGEGAAMAAPRESSLPRPASAPAARTQVPVPRARLTQLELAANRAKEEAARHCEEKKAAVASLTKLRAEHAVTARELHSLRRRAAADEDGKRSSVTSLAKLKPQLARWEMAAAAHWWRGIGRRAGLVNRLDATHGACVALRLSAMRLRLKSNALRGALDGERIRAARAVYRFCLAQTLAFALARWAESATLAAVALGFSRQLADSELDREVRAEGGPGARGEGTLGRRALWAAGGLVAHGYSRRRAPLGRRTRRALSRQRPRSSRGPRRHCARRGSYLPRGCRSASSW